jgi:hypothetical protein
LELEPDRYGPYALPDGTMIVCMKHLSYGYVEAAHYWYKELSSTFEKNNYTKSKKDKCLFIHREAGNVYCAVTVDDGLFAATGDEEWIKQQIEMLRKAYIDITVEQGNDVGVVGMQIRMDRQSKKVIITQPKWVQQVIDKFEVDQAAPTPAKDSLMGDDDTSPELTDQRKFMSLNSLLMYGAHRAYPEICPAVIKNSTKYNKATEDDLKKVIRVAQYVYGCKDTYKLILAPKSMKLIGAGDASYSEHADGKSHTGGVIGFESDSSCYFAYVSSKQPVIAKSVGEAELIAENKISDYIEWSRELLEELGYHQGKLPMYVDSTCAMQMLKQGTGSFKRAKHIKVRFFWKDLIDEGLIELIYTPTEELVADILTKPLNGEKFIYLLTKLIGWNPLEIDMLNDEIFSSIKVVTEEVCWNGVEWLSVNSISQTGRDDCTDNRDDCTDDHV